jgi:two-component system sensor histidine kinase KdpD
MLEEAGRRKSRGSDVVVATVATHGREGVSAALDGLDLIGDGTAVDTEAVLARHPEVVCIDDLTVADPGGSTPSRFSAARQLAEAGINVVATARVGGSDEEDGAVGEAPDEAAVLALADEIEVVDVAPSVLADRVRRGEIVPPGQIEEALRTDYAPQVLAARRERVFALVVQQADRRLADYPSSRAAAGPEPHPRILACVAPRAGQEPLIRRAAAVAAQTAGDLLVGVVAPSAAPDGLDRLLAGYAELAAHLGGEFATLDGHPATALARFAREHQVTEMVLARDQTARPGRYRVLRELARGSTNAELHVLSG